MPRRSAPAVLRDTVHFSALPPIEKPGGNAGRSEVWSLDEVRELKIRCGLGVGSLRDTETIVRLRSRPDDV
jgi:hypothetical protein